MIDWLNENSGAVQAIAVVVLAVVTLVYALKTRDIAQATERQARAGVKMVEAVLTPVLEPRIEETREALLGTVTSVQVNYQNMGEGPAVSIWWTLFSLAGERTSEVQHRAGMAPRAPPGHVDFDVEESLFRNGFLVRAECESAFGVLWSSSLTLKSRRRSTIFPATDEFFLENDGLKVQRIDKRTFGDDA